MPEILLGDSAPPVGRRFATTRGWYRIPRHVVRYVIVGAVCTLFQLAVLQIGLHVARSGAEVVNAAAFVLSTQLNFVLSDRFTWAQRLKPGSAHASGIAVRLVGFNLSALAGLVVNTATFAGAHQLLALPVVEAALVGVGCSTLVNFLLSSRIVFRTVRRPAADCTDSSCEVRIEMPTGNIPQPRRSMPFPARLPAGPRPASEPVTAPIPLPRASAQPWPGANSGRCAVAVPTEDLPTVAIPTAAVWSDAETVVMPPVRTGPQGGRARVLPARPAGAGADLAVLRPLDLDARTTATRWQRAVVSVGLALLVAVVAAAVAGYRIGLEIAVGAISTLYFVDLVFAAYLVTGSLRGTNRSPRQERTELAGWPTFTVLCPMYRETAVLPQFVTAIGALDYPREALQVLLLLEEDDTETIAFASAMNLPAAFEIVVVPDSQPKTKPKACNYGLQIARGDYIVIFDAEDMPEPDQLRKAALAFARLPGNVACLQAPLNFYNPRQNVLTRLFTAEYSLWFDLMLTGLQRLGGPIPLGGTSNHFRTDVLRGLGGWDPFNVTEDADLGIRLYKQGFRTGMLDSTTYEEANPNVRNWIRQRSRWIKGYMQTLLVHTRGGWDLRRTRDPHFLTFLLVVGGKVLVNFINPLMWAVTIGYFVFRGSIGAAIEALYPAPVFYLAVVTLLFGNLLFVYTFLLGSAQRQNHDLIKYGLLAPLYWLMMSVAACKALWQLIRSPHYWEKTQHGLHLHGGPAEQGAGLAGASPGREKVLSR